MATNTRALSQDNRVRCSLPLSDADLSLSNSNWIKGLQAKTDWIWSANLNPAPFPNNLARYFLHIPAVFEQQLNYSTTLIFDEPSFRNGIQISGFLNRVWRELVISFIAQRRHCWYSMTHHAVLGYLTARQHGLSDNDISAKWSRLLRFREQSGVYSDVEIQLLEFADAFATNPKNYSDEQYRLLRVALAKSNYERHFQIGEWLVKQQCARVAFATARAKGESIEKAGRQSEEASQSASKELDPSENERTVDSQVVELAFLCLQFVALTDVFTALNIPDEEFLAAVLEGTLPDAVLATINDLNLASGSDLPDLTPSRLNLPMKAILSGQITVESSPIRGNRIPLLPYELQQGADRDKGVTKGGAQVGVYGWSFGSHFPGSLVYALMLHPELGRFEAPYSLPLLFNEDEWRNGVQTGGFVSRILKELVYQKVYQIVRSRYGLEHHTMFLYNAFLDCYGVGREPRAALSRDEIAAARTRALEHSEQVVFHMLDHNRAPEGVFSALDRAVLSWTERILLRPHSAHELEKAVRQELEKHNRFEVQSGLRVLDLSPGVGEVAAHHRLVDHQIAELVMNIGHMNGLGRALTMLQLESEDAVQVAEGQIDQATGKFKPILDRAGNLSLTGYFNNRPALLEILGMIGVSTRARTYLELLVNPKLAKQLRQKQKTSLDTIFIKGNTAITTAEF